MIEAAHFLRAASVSFSMMRFRMEIFVIEVRYNLLSFANFSIIFFIPYSLKFTVARALSPSPSKALIVLSRIYCA